MKTTLNNAIYNTVELSIFELEYINGGNQASYNNGYSAGSAARKWFDNICTEWAILRFVFL